MFTAHTGIKSKLGVVKIAAYASIKVILALSLIVFSPNRIGGIFTHCSHRRRAITRLMIVATAVGIHAMVTQWDAYIDVKQIAIIFIDVIIIVVTPG